MKTIKSYDLNGYYRYIAVVPDKLRDNLPIIFQLHGRGERGNKDEDLDLVNIHSMTENVFNGQTENDCILILPQCDVNSFWVAEIQTLRKFIDLTVDKFKADKNRIYLTGFSMGGFGTWYTAMAFPDKFAAIVPVCGGGMPWNAEVLKMPVWAFHGDKDQTVLPSNTIDMVNALKKTNPNVKMTIYKGVEHNAWDYAYTRELYDWLLQFKKQ